MRRENIFNILRSKDFGTNINDHSFRLIAYAVKGFYQTNHFNEAYALVNVFKKPVNRATLYAFAATELLREQRIISVTQLLDSAQTEILRVNTISYLQPDRQLLGYALTMQNPKNNSSAALALIKNLEAKFIAIRLISRGYAMQKELYQAIQNIPENVSDTDQADFIDEILYGFAEKSATPPTWNEFNKSYVGVLKQWINYEDE